MATVLRIIGLSTGEPTEFDGMLVAAYDPTWWRPDGSYDGGILEVTDKPDRAMVFPDAVTAIEKWREAYGVRLDGKPNRPLTAFTVSVENL